MQYKKNLIQVKSFISIKYMVTYFYRLFRDVCMHAFISKVICLQKYIFII